MQILQLSCKYKISLMKDFSWPILFFVTGFSCLLFSGIIKMLEGDLSRPYLWIGFASLFLGLLEWAGRSFAKASGKRKRKKLYS